MATEEKKPETDNIKQSSSSSGSSKVSTDRLGLCGRTDAAWAARRARWLTSQQVSEQAWWNQTYATVCDAVLVA